MQPVGCSMADEIMTVLRTCSYYNVNLTVRFYAVALAASVNTRGYFVPNWITSRHNIFLFCFNNPILSHNKQLVNKKDKKNYLPVRPQPVGISRTIVRPCWKKIAGQNRPAEKINTKEYLFLSSTAQRLQYPDLGVCRTRLLLIRH